MNLHKMKFDHENHVYLSNSVWFEQILCSDSGFDSADVVTHWARFYTHTALQPCITGRILQLASACLVENCADIQRAWVLAILHCGVAVNFCWISVIPVNFAEYWISGISQTRRIVPSGRNSLNSTRWRSQKLLPLSCNKSSIHEFVSFLYIFLVI